MDRNHHTPRNTVRKTMSPPARVAWIETSLGQWSTDEMRSPPARVAWIETSTTGVLNHFFAVATREGGVDRNSRDDVAIVNVSGVATREGGVDRNRTEDTFSAPRISRYPRGWRG